MRTVKFTKDFTFNTDGSQHGRVSKQAGQTGHFPDHIADKLVNHWKVARYHDMRPQETKPAAPSGQKATYTAQKYGAWYWIQDEDGDTVDKVQGEQAKDEKLEVLNG